MATTAEREAKPVLVTGATGTVSSEVVAQLRNSSVRFRIANRDLSRVDASDAESTTIEFDL